MENNRIKLTEGELHQLVNDAVQQVLVDEGLWDSIKGGASALGGVAKKGFQNNVGKFGDSMRNSVRNAAQRVGQGVQNAYDKTKEVGSSMYNTMQAGARNANIQAAKNKAINSLNAFLTQAQKTPGVVGNSTLQAVQQCIRMLNQAGGRSRGNMNANINSTLNKVGLR